MIQQFSAAVRDGAPIITANQRLARAWQRLFDEHQRESGLTAWTSPRILPWPAWVQSLWSEGVISGRIPASTRLAPHQTEAVWRTLVEQSPESADILQPRPAAASALSAWSLVQQYRIPWKKLHFEAHDDWMTFYGWARAFEERCASPNWIDDVRLADMVAAAIRDGAIVPPARLVLGGFDEFTPQQSALLDALLDAGCPHEIVASVDQMAPPVRVPQLDRITEVRAAARWARDLLERERRARIGVVIPDIQSRRATVDRVFTEVFHPDWILGLTSGRAAFHISLGTPLTDWPAVHAAFLLLKLTQPVMRLADAGAILRSRFITGERDDANARAQQDARLRRGRPAEVASTLVLPAAVERWNAIRRPLPHECRPSEWAAAVTAFLEAAGWPGQHTADSAEYQSIEAWADLLRRFSSLDLVCGPMTFDTAIARLRELAAATQFQPEDPDAPVQITGALEAAGAGYDHLWIAGLDDESWPRAAHPHPFLPPSLQIEYGLPHCSADREFEFARRTTERLLATAPDVVVSHAERDNDRTLRPSVLIRDLPVGHVISPDDDYARRLASRVTLDAQPDHMAPPVSEHAAIGGTAILKSQAQCPFRAFAQIRLGARTLEQGVLGVDPMEHGNSLHKALELFWRAVQSQQRLMAMNATELAALVRRVAEEAVAKAGVAPVNALDKRFHELEVDRVELVLGAWLDVERRREPFEVVQIEEKRRIDVAGLEIKTRVDRVDRLPSGEHVILDYKTTAPSLNSWEGERLDEPQVPLYATSMEVPVGAVAFAQLTPNELRFKGLANENGVLPQAKVLKDGTVEGKIVDWRRALERLSRDYQRGYAAVDPKKGACAYCGLDALCRVHENPPTDGEENGDA